MKDERTLKREESGRYTNPGWLTVFACSTVRAPLENWTSKVKQNAQKTGIEYKGPRPYQRSIDDVEVYTREFRFQPNDRVKQVISVPTPDVVHIEIGTGIDPDAENILPEEELTDSSDSTETVPHQSTQTDSLNVDETGNDNSVATDENQSPSSTEQPRGSAQTSSETENQPRTQSASDDEITSHEQPNNDLETLRERATAAAEENVPVPEKTQTQTKQEYTRSNAVREYVLARASGDCEGCGEPAPFTSKSGHPYLHAHHINELSDGGSDTPATVVALCPNCHYKIHHGVDGDEFNEHLREKISQIENS